MKNSFVDIVGSGGRAMAAVLVLFAALAMVLGGTSVYAGKRQDGHKHNGSDMNNLAADRGLEPRGSEKEALDERAFQDYVDGLLYEGLGEYDNAARAYANALSRHPESPTLAASYALVLYRSHRPLEALQAMKDVKESGLEVHDLRAQCYRVLGDDVSAKQEYLKIIALDTLNQMAYSYLGAFYDRRGDVDSVIWAYTNLARLQPDNYEIFNEIGRLQYSRGRTDESIEAFRRSLEVEPGVQNYPTYVTLADMYRAAGRLDSTEAVLLKALSFDEGNVRLRRFLVGMYFAEERYDDALPHLQTIVELEPNNLETQRHLATLYMALDSSDQAQAILQEIVASGSPEFGDYFALGQIAGRGENWREAARQFKRATGENPAIADGWLALGQSYRQIDEGHSEVATYLEGVDHMRNEEAAIQLYFAAGAAYERQDQVDSAISVFEMILEHDPNNDQVLNYLGYTLADRGIRLDYADELIERAIAIQPNNAAYLDSYGWVKFRLGDHEAAVEYLARAAALDNDPEILHHLGDAYWALGEHEQARRAWRQVLEVEPDNKTIQEKLDR